MAPERRRQDGAAGQCGPHVRRQSPAGGGGARARGRDDGHEYPQAQEAAHPECLPTHSCADERATKALRPRGLVPTHVLTGALYRVAPILVRHAVAVLLAEVSETDRDPNAFQRVAFEVGVDREQLRLGIPA